MRTEFNFIEKETGKSFYAQKVRQIDGTWVYAVSWIENHVFKVLLISVGEVKLELETESWQIID